MSAPGELNGGDKSPVGLERGDKSPLVLKFGGELLETTADRARMAGVVAAIASERPLVIVHGGGRAIDAELDRRGIAPKKVDGLRITDADTLDVVISVLGGGQNTALVAALVAQGVRAVGLTGVDAGLGRATRRVHQSAAGQAVDLGFVGDPADTDAALVALLLENGYVPVIASLGLDAERLGDDGNGTAGTSAILNVNADVMACRIAAALAGSDLVIAGGTPGVLDDEQRSIPSLDQEGIDRLIASGTANAGMVAKLSACRTAIASGVRSVRIVNGHALDGAGSLDRAPGTWIAA